MNCFACNKANAACVSFSEFFGASLRSAPASTSVALVSRTALSQPAPPFAADVAQMAKSFLGSLSLDEKFVGVDR